MVQKILHRIIKRRHNWRDIALSELTELYISSMLRTFALSLLMVFLPYYLYQNGYSFAGIFSFYGIFFGGKIIADLASSLFIARYGPKHAMIVSYILQIISAALLLSLPQYHWPSWLIAPLFGASASFFFIAYHVEFSKIKHTLHSGKEIGEMQMFEKIAAIAGPLFGGFAGTYLGSNYIFLTAAIVLCASLWPLFRTAEPVRIHQKIRYRLLPLSRLTRDYTSYVALGIENTLCINLWPMYLSIFALGTSIYARLGVLSSVAVAVSVAASYAVGRYADKRSARRALRLASVLNALLYAVRPFVHSVWPALAVSVVNDAINPGYRLPYLKGMYAAADDLPGCRIVYIASMECLGSITKALAWFLLAALATFYGGKTVIFIGFSIAAVASFAIMTEKFSELASPRAQVSRGGR